MLIVELISAADRMFLKRQRDREFDRLPWVICRELPLLRSDAHVAVGLWV